MEKIKKTCKLQHLFMAYHLVFVLYMLAAIPITVILTGKYALLVFLGSAFVTGLAIYACIKQKVKPSLLHGLALAFYAWLLVSVLYHFDETGADNWMHLLLLFCLVFPSFLGFLTFSKAQIVAQWKVLAVSYNLVMTVLSIIGIRATVLSIHMLFPAIGYKYISFLDLKLYILSHYNTTAHMLAFAMLLCLFMMLHTNKRWVRILFAIDLVIFYITLGLTYSRTVELTISACFAIAICYFIWHAKKLQTPTLQIKNIALRLALCGVAFFAIVAVSYSGMVAANTQGSALRISIAAEQKAAASAQATAARTLPEENAADISLLATQSQPSAPLTLSTAQEGTVVLEDAASTSETTEEGPVPLTEEERLAILQESRSLSNLNTMAARFAYWSAALTYFAETPACQLWGESPAGVVQVLAQVIPDYQPPHTHNVFIQVLLATGVPGFLCFIALWGIALFDAIKRFFAPSGRFAEGCFPLLLILTFTALGLQENIMFSLESSPMLAVYFMAVAALASLKQPHNNTDTTPQ